MSNLSKKTFIVALAIILFVVGVSVGGTIILSSFSYQNLPENEEWTPRPSLTPSLTPVIEEGLSGLDPSSTPSLTPTARQNCTYPLSYWVENEERWPLQTVFGYRSFFVVDIQGILEEKNRDLQDELVLQMYFVYLNILFGADDETIAHTLEEADDWLKENIDNDSISSEVRLAGITLAGTLSDFNLGVIGPGPCYPYLRPTLMPTAFDPSTSTPEVSSTPGVTPTRPFITFTPTPTSTATKKDADPDPTRTLRPATNTPPPPPTSTDQPTQPPPTQPPTQPPTSAPPENTPVPTQPPAPTDPPQPPSPTPAG
jgi:hypothetical protein